MLFLNLRLWRTPLALALTAANPDPFKGKRSDRKQAATLQTHGPIQKKWRDGGRGDSTLNISHFTDFLLHSQTHAGLSQTKAPTPHPIHDSMRAEKGIRIERKNE